MIPIIDRADGGEQWKNWWWRHSIVATVKRRSDDWRWLITVVVEKCWPRWRNWWNCWRWRWCVDDSENDRWIVNCCWYCGNCWKERWLTVVAWPSWPVEGIDIVLAVLKIVIETDDDGNSDGGIVIDDGEEIPGLTDVGLTWLLSVGGRKETDNGDLDELQCWSDGVTRWWRPLLVLMTEKKAEEPGLEGGKILRPVVTLLLWLTFIDDRRKVWQLTVLLWFVTVCAWMTLVTDVAWRWNYSIGGWPVLMIPENLGHCCWVTGLIVGGWLLLAEEPWWWYCWYWRNVEGRYCYWPVVLSDDGRTLEIMKNDVVGIVVDGDGDIDEIVTGRYVNGHC